MLGHRARCAFASFVLLAAATTSVSAQVSQLIVPGTTLAPGSGFGTVPKALELDVLTVVPEDALGLVTAHHLRDTQKMIEDVLRKLSVPVDGSDEYAEFNQFL